MPQLRSRTTTHGRNMAGARALWRATGMGDDDFGKPIVAVANSFTQFVPGHVHLRNLGALVSEAIAYQHTPTETRIILTFARAVGENWVMKQTPKNLILIFDRRPISG